MKVCPSGEILPIWSHCLNVSRYKAKCFRIFEKTFFLRKKEEVFDVNLWASIFQIWSSIQMRGRRVNANKQTRIDYIKAHSHLPQQSVDSAVDCINAEIENFLSLCGNATVCRMPQQQTQLVWMGLWRNRSKTYFLIKIILLKKWANPGLFWFFRSFQTNNANFTTNQCEKMSKCPSSIQCWDSNPRPYKHESSPVTTPKK